MDEPVKEEDSIDESSIEQVVNAVGKLIPEDFSKLTEGIPEPGRKEVILITGGYMARLPLKDMEEKQSSTRLKIILKGNEAERTNNKGGMIVKKYVKRFLAAFPLVVALRDS